MTAAITLTEELTRSHFSISLTGGWRVVRYEIRFGDRTCQSTLEQAILDYREFGTTVVRGMKLE